MISMAPFCRMLPVYTRAHETLLLERQRHSCRGQERAPFRNSSPSTSPTSCACRKPRPRKARRRSTCPDYHEYWNSAEKKGYSGTAIFSKQEPIKVINGFPDGFAKKFTFADELKRDSWNEGRVITAEFEKFHVVTVYTPNAKDDLSRLKLRHEHWDPAFLAYVQATRQEEAGDLLRRSQCRAHRARSGESEAQSRARKVSPTRSAKASRISSTPASSTPSASSRRATATIRGGAHFANSRARNVGWRIDYVLVSEALQKKVKEAKIHADVHGLGSLPGEHQARHLTYLLHSGLTAASARSYIHPYG